MEFVSLSQEVVFFPASEKFASPISGGVRFLSQKGDFSVSPGEVCFSQSGSSLLPSHWEVCFFHLWRGSFI
jgi:hypothetical protein